MEIITFKVDSMVSFKKNKTDPKSISHIRVPEWNTAWLLIAT